MNANESYFIDIVLTVMGLFFLIYLIYGRVKRKSLIGGYEPGKPGYDVFFKLVHNPKYLYISIAVTLFFIISSVLDARAVLEGTQSRSILVVAPVMAVLALFLCIFTLSAVFSKK